MTELTWYCPVEVICKLVPLPYCRQHIMLIALTGSLATLCQALLAREWNPSKRIWKTKNTVSGMATASKRSFWDGQATTSWILLVKCINSTIKYYFLSVKGLLNVKKEGFPCKFQVSEESCLHHSSEKSKTANTWNFFQPKNFTIHKKKCTQNNRVFSIFIQFLLLPILFKKVANIPCPGLLY